MAEKQSEPKAETIRVFAGYDPRERNGFHVWLQSLLDTAEYPFLSVHPLNGEQRDGTNTFAFARFLVPWLCHYKGWAIFLDGSDMLMLRDITELWALRDENFAVQVVQHDYRTRNRRKYIGTEMEAVNEDYPRKNWSSVIIWNCEHPANRALTPKLIEQAAGSFLHRFSWLQDQEIGALPAAWNRLIREQPCDGKERIAHFTLGIPHIEEYRKDPYAEEYRKTLASINAPLTVAQEVAA